MMNEFEKQVFEKRIRALETKIIEQNKILDRIQNIIEKKYTTKNNSSITASMDGEISLNKQ